MLKSGATCVRKCFKIGLPSSWFRQTEVTIGENIKLMTTKEIVAAGPVSRILSAGRNRQDGHSSRPRIAARLKRPTRRFDAPSQRVSGVSPTSRRMWGHPLDFLPIWSCSVWGLPCLSHCCNSGTLLPHLFTLTQPVSDLVALR